MRMEPDDAKAIREITAAMVVETCSAAKKNKELEYELALLKRSYIFAPTAQQLKTDRQEINNLKTLLDAV